MELQRDARGKLKLGPDGDPLPPLWMPTELYASDAVATGEAVGSLLSVGGGARRPAAGRTMTAQEARAAVDQAVARAKPISKLAAASASRSANIVRSLALQRNRARQIELLRSTAAQNQYGLMSLGRGDLLCSIGNINKDTRIDQLDSIEHDLLNAVQTVRSGRRFA